MSDGPIIAVADLVRRFGDTAVLDGASLEVDAGEYVAITGPSGSGKSTLLNLLAALDRPDDGTITVADVELTRLHRLTRFRRNQVGLVFQLHNLVPRLTATQNVAMAMFGTGLHRRQRHERAVDLLDQVDLAHRVDAKPPTMSGGERQRVAVARALANRPAVLLADEPTGSLDDRAAEQVLDLFSALQHDEGVTVVAVSHDQRLNRRADRLLVLEGGHIAPAKAAEERMH